MRTAERGANIEVSRRRFRKVKLHTAHAVGYKVQVGGKRLIDEFKPFGAFVYGSYVANSRNVDALISHWAFVC